MRSSLLTALVPGALACFLGPRSLVTTGEPSRTSSDSLVAPPSDVTKAVERALGWLAAHQAPDGSWDCDGFMQQCGKEGPACDGRGGATNDVGVTGLALLAFLGASTKEHEDTVERGLAWLRGQQDEHGCIGKRVGEHFLYNHACAALALAEAYAATRAEALREPLGKAVDFILESRNPYAAWRYSSPGNGDNDTSVTGWMVKVLASAKQSELEVAAEAFTGALTFIDAVTDPETGRTGYNTTGSWSARTPNGLKLFPPEKSEAMTAVGVLTRFGAGRTTKDDPLIAKGAHLLASKPPKWEAGAIDFYYWYYASQALRRVGGSDRKQWSSALKAALLDHQRKDKEGHVSGSWDLEDPWSADGGRVYATALNCLSLEVCDDAAKSKR